MIPALTALAEMAGIGIATAFVVFLRVGAAMAMLPAFGEQSVPVRVRLGLAVVFTLIVAPSAGPMPALDGPGGVVGLPLATEVAIGLALGATIRLFVVVLQMAGSMAAQTMSLAQIFGGQTGADPLPAFGHIMVMAGLALAVAMNLHVKLAAFLIGSYQMLPAGQFPDPADFAAWGVDRIGKAFALGFALAIPFVITSLIYNLTLGVINRAMPQLMVAFIGAPAITLAGLALLAVSLPFVLGVWLSTMDAFLADPAGAPR